ncbi:MAG: carbohydrate ABC transporter permease [Anaerolineae bacterium]|nr:carbohydrate ABC transporter permease [Anaerolineae bacterium]MBN8619623.1 carbohydrate ABC transporter permease [Anaerolineae bacterium]
MATITPAERQNWHAVQAAQHRRQRINKLLLTIVTGAILLVFVYPIYFWVTASVRPYREIFTMPPPLAIYQPTGSWWSVVIGGRPYLEVVQEVAGANAGTGGAGTAGYYVVPFLRTSIIVGVISTAVVLLIATPTAYGLSRFQPRGKQNLVFFILSTRFMPAVTAVLPIYLVYQNFKLIDTYHGLIFAHTVINLPIAVLLMKSFFDDVPQDLDDAAMVDGCTRWGAFFRVIVRYVAPGMAAAAVLCLIFSWNEFIFTLYLTRSPELRTIPVAMSTFDSSSGGTEWGFLTAAGSAAMIPVFIFMLFVQRHLVRGLTMGAVRG